MKDVTVPVEFNVYSLYTTFNSLDFFYMTCLMCDLAKFLHDYQLNPKKWSSDPSLKLPWHLDVSYLKNLLCKQLTQISPQLPPETTVDLKLPTEKNDALSKLKNFTGFKAKPNEVEATPNPPNKANLLLESEKSHLDYLNSIKSSLESVVLSLLDFGTESSLNVEKFSYLTSSIDDDADEENADLPISMCAIYSLLCQMFDIKLKNITTSGGSASSSNEIKFLAEKNLSDASLSTILVYFKLQQLIDLSMVKKQYERFYDTFFEVIREELAEIELNDQSSLQQRSLMEPSLGLKRKFIDFVYQSNTKIKDFCPTISFLALNYLILPSIVEFKEPFNSREYINSAMGVAGPLTNLEVSILEQKLKIINAIESFEVFGVDTINIEEISEIINQMVA